MPFGNSINWEHFVALFLSLAGYIAGLGAVIVIDLHGFLGRKSSYWTVATTRTHKVTKPLIWIGIFLVVFGELLLYKNNYLAPIALVHFILAGLLILNGCFLSFSVSPYMLEREMQGREGELLPAPWQRKIMVSLIASDIGWWGSLLVLVYYIVTSRL